VVPGPAEDHGPGDGAAVRTAEAEGVDPGEDAVAADEGEFALGALGAEEVVDRALLLGGEGGVAGAFASVVAGAPPAGAPRSGLAGREAAEEAPVDASVVPPTPDYTGEMIMRSRGPSGRRQRSCRMQRLSVGGSCRAPLLEPLQVSAFFPLTSVRDSA